MALIKFLGGRYTRHDSESVLDALRRGGAPVSFSCRKGSCQVCVLRVVSGDPGETAREGLREQMKERGYFLPCRSHPQGDLTVERGDLAELFVRARVCERQALSGDVVRLRLEPELNMSWRAGQLVNVRSPDGVTRSYSIASVPELDYFLELHVRRTPGGAVSGWLCDRLGVDDEIEIQGPRGELGYQPGRPEQPLLMVGTGSGLAPLWGVARDALRQGHTGPITLYHGSRSPEGLYLVDELRALEAEHPNFRYVPCLSGPEVPGGYAPGRASDVVRSRHPDLTGWRLFAAGRPEMVHALRWHAVLAGIDRTDVLADPFEGGPPRLPDDSAIIASIPASPELWQAIGEEDGLTALLTDFYERVFTDPRLAPFFHKVTRRRAIEKQFEFLRDLLTGERNYFGLRPFNAHHWMVISDELFDYREALFEACLRRRGLPERLVRRWLALHELFRRELVKAEPRGMVIDGVEQPLASNEDVTIDVGSLCDRCGGELAPGALARYHGRTGELVCMACGAHEARAAG